MKPPTHLIRSARSSLLLLLLSAGVGLGINALRSDPLPLVYEPPGAKFDAGEFAAGTAGDAWASGIHLVDLATTRRLVEERAALVLDARPDLFYEFGRLPGAENLARKNFEADFERLAPLLDQAREARAPLLLYCAHQHCDDASEVAERLADSGHETILIFEGGYREWEEANLKIAKSG